MSLERQPDADEPTRRPEGEPGRDRNEEAEKGEGTGRGAEAYGGDPDAGPSVTEGEVEAGMERDQAEG